ncbi:MAG: hypothetical protein RLN83_01265 [Balneola sp.]
MTEEERKNILRKFYLKLKDTLLKNKALHGPSCFISLIKISSNKRDQYLRESSIIMIRLDFTEAKLLLKNNSLMKLEGGYEGDSLILTGRTIWEFDKIENDLSEDDLVSYFEQKDFQLSNVSAKLTAKEKRVLMTLIAMRCFDELSSLDLNNKTKNKYWDEVYEQINNTLIDYRINKKTDALESFKRSTTIEHEIIRVNDLTKKTFQLFKLIGNKEYVLDVSTNEEINQEKLQYLFKLLLYNCRLSAKDSHDFHNELLLITHNYASKLKESSLYTDVQTDGIIFESIKGAVLNRL